MATLLPVQVFAETPDYISEIKIFMGDYKNASSEGYKILGDGSGNPVDLNQGSGSTDTGAKGNKKVYLGYKTTKDRKEAISDLALMNMKGGYDVAEYEALMEKQMKEQIIPFVNDFLVSINEYRDNYNSKNKKNNQRAKYIHDMLNKLIDDDTGKPIGDLLLNQTKYEMGDEAYNKLSEEEKKNHADILTIIAQANGKATLLLENMLIRAGDTNTDSWIDRLSETTYEDLLDATGMAPTDARKKLSKNYDDDAQKLLRMWSAFREELLTYDDAQAYVDEYDESDATDAYDEAEALDEDSSHDEADEALENAAEAVNGELKLVDKASIIAVHDYLEGIEYGDGTMLDFFLTPEDEITDDIEMLYPVAAALTDGQKAGLEFVTLKELVMIAGTAPGDYKAADLEELKPASIYEGVDRAIYEKGGVALTSDAIRNKKSALIEPENDSLSALSIAFIVISSAAALGFVASTIAFAVGRIQLHRWPMLTIEYSAYGWHPNLTTQYYNNAVRNSTWGGRCMVGFGVAAVILTIVTLYLSYNDMKAHYKVDFTPIPHYMVDEKDITGYNSKGEKIVLKNQSAYYKAVQCNRKKGDEYFNTVDTCADLNGDVNKQWLALYAAKNEAWEPILASSLRAVVGSSALPAGYKTGIHMFGSDAAFNLNSSLYCWNKSAKSVIVYYKTDDSAPSSSASNFSGGMIALAAGGGLIVGVFGTILATSKKRKDNKTVTV